MSQGAEAARAKLASLARQTTEDINSRQTVPLPAEKVRASPLRLPFAASCPERNEVWR